MAAYSHEREALLCDLTALNNCGCGLNIGVGQDISLAVLHIETSGRSSTIWYSSAKQPHVKEVVQLKVFIGYLARLTQIEMTAKMDVNVRNP